MTERIYPTPYPAQARQSLATSAYGEVFDPAASSWRLKRLGRDQTLYFDKLGAVTTPNLLFELKSVFQVLAETRNASTCHTALTVIGRTAEEYLKTHGKPLGRVSADTIITASSIHATAVSLWHMC